MTIFFFAEGAHASPEIGVETRSMLEGILRRDKGTHAVSPGFVGKRLRRPKSERDAPDIRRTMLGMSGILPNPSTT